MESFVSVVLLGGLISLILFAIVFLIANSIRNYGLADPFWAIAIPLLTVYYSLAIGSFSPAAILFIALVLLWHGRLAWHLGKRFWREHPREDPRYTELRKRWGNHAAGTMFGFYLLQAVLGWFLTIPIAIVLWHPEAIPGIWGILGVILLLAAVTGEMIADWQLQRALRSPRRQSLVFREGLWAYSRHPNYFFQWLGWVGVAVFALGSPPWGYLGMLSPALMFYLLHHVTGIPPVETRMLARKGIAYRDYQREVSAFFPLPRSHSH